MGILRDIALMQDPLIPAIEVDPNSVTPGWLGFVVTFVVMMLVLVLVLDMVRRVRRVRYRAEISEKLDGITPPVEDQ